MIDRDRIEKIRAWAEAPHAKPTFDELAKLCLLGLSVIDAPEGVTVRNEYGCTEIQGVFAEEGKRVRLVVVEDGNDA